METSDKRRSWTPSWKGVIITVLVGVIIILIRFIEARGCLLCPLDWRLHGDLCYHYSDVTERTWSQSRGDCKMMGADLLVIKDEEQQEIIQRSIIQRRENTYWLGLTHNRDVWRWLNGERYYGSLIQIKTEGSGRCASMTGSDYYQDNCDARRRRICVKKAMRI